MKKSSITDWIPKTGREWHFMIWLVTAVITFFVTAFLPIILSLWTGNWLHMAIYWFIAAPLFFEAVVFYLWFKVIDL